MTRTLGKKIEVALNKGILANHGFELRASPTGLDNTFVLRVITTAWSNRNKAHRIDRVHELIMPILSKEESDRIFRISVLTPNEWKMIKQDLVDSNSRKIGGLSTARSAASCS